MSQRDDITELLMGQQGWDALPMSENVEDRRPTDPLQAYVTPPPMQLEGSHQPQSWLDVIEHVPNDGTMRYPGSMPLDMGADIERYAANEAKISQPDQFGGPVEVPDMRMHEALERMRLTGGAEVDHATGTIMRPDRGHLGYADTLPVGAKLYVRDPPMPYIPKPPPGGLMDKKYDLPQPTGGGPSQMDLDEIDELLRRRGGG